MSLKSRILLAMALTVPAAQALGADFDAPIVYEPPVVEAIEEYVPVEVGSGWYLRGDVGYSFSTAARGAFTYSTFDGAAYTDGTYDTASYSSGLSFGAGFGYHFSDLMRADLTAENFNLRFNGTRATCVMGAAVSCTDTADMNAWSVMLNGYVDVATIAGFTPYVGAGAGVTYAQWGTAATTSPSFAGSATHPGMSNWRFSWAAMAGVSYDINKNLKVDLSYKYRNVAGGAMFGYDTISAAAGATGAEARDPGFSQHEVRLGLRYELW